MPFGLQSATVSDGQMLLRVYRLTDKFGVILIKLSGALGAWIVQGVQGTVATIGGVFGLILAIILGILNVLLSILRIIASGIGALLSLVGVGVRRSAKTTVSVGGSGVQSVRTRVEESMARRAARDEVDVVINEDPLRIQNRQLSFLVLVLGIFVVGAVYIATDPSRGTNTPLGANLGADPALLLPAATAPSTGTNQDVGLIAPLPTVIPTATAVPAALSPRGSVAYVQRDVGQTDLWVVPVGSRNPVRITNNPADERDPEWNSTGTRLAYASRADGNWELYIYDLALQESERFTFDLSFHANPSWSPDDLWLAHEYYRNGNLDIWALRIDTAEPIEITNHPAPDFSPDWSPANDGREIAFVSWRDGNQDIYVIDLNTRDIINVTNTPLINEDHPKWSPDGRFIAYSALDQGSEKVFVKNLDNPSEAPQVLGFGREPAWSPDGSSVVFAVDSIDGSRTEFVAVSFGDGGVPSQIVSAGVGATSPTWSLQTTPPNLVSSGGLPLGIDSNLFVEQASESPAGAPYRLQNIGNVQVDPPLLSDRVDDSFVAVRQRVLESAGYDFLGELDDAFWSLDRPVEPGTPRRSWHMTGRSIAIVRNKILGFPPIIEIMREDLGVNTFWRVYVRVDDASQSGQLGEPLRDMPWDFTSVEGGDVEAYNLGGRLRPEMPQGYYIDLTQIMSDYGWAREPAGAQWRANANTRNYWLFTKRDALEWFEAMQEIYTDGEIAGFAPQS